MAEGSAGAGSGNESPIRAKIERRVGRRGVLKASAAARRRISGLRVPKCRTNDGT